VLCAHSFPMSARASAAAAAAAAAPASSLADQAEPCCICVEPLWGPNPEGERGVADLSCRHAFHSKCLVGHTKREVQAALDSGHAEYGYGGFGGPRGSCPLCRNPVSMWIAHSAWWQSPSTWVPAIERVLTALGPRVDGRSSGRDWKQVYQELVNEHCAELDEGEMAEATKAMEDACRSCGSVPEITKESFSFSRGLWDLHEFGSLKRLWLFEWGPVQRAQLARRGGGWGGRR